ncbi:MAG: plasma-membrane proton-efflux P-type ATPase [Candidatus Marsarchaeota archaeon]|nr:plasma-membrane proton-efflux P-type ATPase [Candidatus Marsarchaeota archaeon]
MEYKYANVTDALKKLNTNPKLGLTKNDIEKRRITYGFNEINDKKVNPLKKLAERFYGPIPFMLEIVIIITYLIGHYTDTYTVFALLIFNGVIGFFEENKADNSIELLKKKLNIKARALRSKNWSIIDARELLPGDIIRVRMGDVVPADCMVIKADTLEADQSTLTGESYPVKKNTSDMVFSGSRIVRGESLLVVLSIGYNTSYGKTAKLVEMASPRQHLQNLIVNITKHLILLDMIIIMFLGIIATEVFGYNIIQLLPFLLVILIASVPVALPAAFTTTMALGTEKLSKKSILVTKLEAIESAATMNVLCFDKTGTITENKLSIKEIFTLEKISEEELLQTASICSRVSDNDPIDNAILNYSENQSISIDKYKLIKFVPFEPATKMSSATFSYNGRIFEASKGALSAITKKYKIEKSTNNLLIKKTTEFSKRNLRTLVVVKLEGNKLSVLGIIAMYDSPRPEAKSLINELRLLGIQIKILTGDNSHIAKQIAEEVGVNGAVVDARELRKKDQNEIQSIIKNSNIFAEIYPEDKFTIVKSLQALGYRVGMTGDGVNDAPALKQAEVGIAVENATDIAKSVSELILEKNGISVIVDAIKESRKIFEKMKTYAVIKVTRVIQILFYISIAFVALQFLPILPFELILLIFTNDIINISVSTDNTSFSDYPDKWDTQSIFKTSILFGIGMLAISLIFIPIGLIFTSTHGQFETFSFLMISITDTILLYLVRGRFKLFGNMPSPLLLMASIASMFFSIILSFYGIIVSSINIYAIGAILFGSIVMLLLFDVIKTKAFKYIISSF